MNQSETSFTMIKHYLSTHKDVIEILIAGGAGLGAMLSEIEQGLRILIGIATLGFILYKWRCRWVDRNKK